MPVERHAGAKADIAPAPRARPFTDEALRCRSAQGNHSSVELSMIGMYAMERHSTDAGRVMTDPPVRESSGDRAAITELLAELRAGRREAFDQIVPLVYEELHRAAHRELGRRPSDTLSTTGLVHELYLKFARTPAGDWQSRAHFLGVAAVAMRHILVDRARRRTAGKRGGHQRVVTLEDALVANDEQAESLLELHDALEQLAKVSERLARVVECRFFGGMTEQETAESLGVTERTVRRDWVKARGLLYQTLGADVADSLAPRPAPSPPPRPAARP
jgi:RNA polymerase sigma factor (TIGR02999 family)